MEVSKVIGGNSIFRVNSGGANKKLEYSVNQNLYTEFEYSNSYNGDSDKTEWISINGKYSIITVRDKNTKEIYSKAIIINDKNYPLAIVKTTVGHQNGSKGSYVSLGFAKKDIPVEYSIDNGKNFYPVFKENSWSSSIPMVSDTLFSDRVIIRNKDTKETIYESPKIGDIEEKYIYENGKTTIKFNINGDAKDNVSYTYVINGEKNNGNTIVLESDSQIELQAYTNKEFVEQRTQKEIQAKVINIEKPVMETDEENNLIITGGAVINDELGDIYYSIDGGEYKLYSEGVKLQSGTHTINAYQLTKEHGVKSLIETGEFTIEEKIEDSNQGNEDNKNDESDNKEDDKENNNEEINKEEDNKEENEGNNKEETDDQTSNEEKEQANNEHKNEEQKKEDKETPKTGDKVYIYIIAVFVIILLNIVIKQKRKNNRKVNSIIKKK